MFHGNTHLGLSWKLSLELDLPYKKDYVAAGGQLSFSVMDLVFYTTVTFVLVSVLLLWGETKTKATLRRERIELGACLLFQKFS